ncbi:MAG: triosephosphate isomerase [Myxococcota bacterium]|jgi:triosephosphate isomerase
MSINKKVIIANWKMNSSFDELPVWIENFSKEIIKQKSLSEIILCPPAIMLDYADEILMENELNEIEKLHGDVEKMKEEDLEEMIAKLRIIKLGGQDCGAEDKGAFTGDISAKMLKDCGAYYVILGHSERRQFHLETNELIAKKVATSVKQDLIPILCVGESKEKRDSGEFADFIIAQVQNSIPQDLEINKLVLAYEPIWSIGSGVLPTISQIEEVATLIKEELLKNTKIKHFKIAYGGSVNSKNSGEILTAKNIDGLLVGGASLDADEFLGIVKSA